MYPSSTPVDSDSDSDPDPDSDFQAIFSQQFVVSTGIFHEYRSLSFRIPLLFAWTSLIILKKIFSES
jgi:hypothetical protein